MSQYHTLMSRKTLLRSILRKRVWKLCTGSYTCNDRSGLLSQGIFWTTEELSVSWERLVIGQREIQILPSPHLNGRFDLPMASIATIYLWSELLEAAALLHQRDAVQYAVTHFAMVDGSSTSQATSQNDGIFVCLSRTPQVIICLVSIWKVFGSNIGHVSGYLLEGTSEIFWLLAMDW
jgi:hypothetical protein